MPIGQEHYKAMTTGRTARDTRSPSSDEVLRDDEAVAHLLYCQQTFTDRGLGHVFRPFSLDCVRD